ncbi:hypothetical protein JQK62_26560, partial [Leptospira santarosai]|nr:hypothetical protein [Leptospira santarosai]
YETNGSIQGFQQVFWNGVTTLELAKAIEWIIHNDLVGLVHLSVDGKISKYDLLHLLRNEFNKNDIYITPN